MKQALLLLTAIAMAFFQLNAQVMPTIIANGFDNNLIGIDVDADGNIWLAEMGTGNDDGTITYIEPDGDPVVFMTGLPSGFNDAGEIAGPNRTFQLPNNKVLILVGEGPHAQAQSLLYVDKSDFVPSSPLTLNDVEQSIKIGDFVLSLGFSNSNPYNLDWDADGNMYIVDAGGNSVIKRDVSTGNLSLFKTLDAFPNPTPIGPPFIEPVPTGILTKADGSGFYLCQLTGFPFVQNAANIYNLDLSGNLSIHADSFSCLTDIGFDPTDGNLCAMQFAVFGPVDSTLNFYPGTGLVIKLLPGGNRDTIGSGMIGLNPSFDFDAEGNLYVTDLFGFVYKFDFATATGEAQALAVNVNAFPNPFSEAVKIAFDLEKTTPVKMNIYNLKGKLIKAFAEQNMPAGPQSITWDARGAEPGHYLYHLLVDGKVANGLLNLGR